MTNGVPATEAGRDGGVVEPMPVMENTLFYGDNLDVLRKHLPDATVDLVYLDPPFNSQRDYNILFKEQSGAESPAQIKAFGDTWNWAGAMEAWANFSDLCPNAKVIELMNGFHNTLGENDVMAYLVMMAPRLFHLHRVLKPTGSLYLHCDPTASHYLKLVLDCIFDVRNFRNEISWRRSNPKSHNSTNFANCRDIILRYTKTQIAVFNKVFAEHDPEYVAKAYRFKDNQGRRYRLLPLLNPNDDRPNLTYEFLGVTRVWRWTKDRMAKAYAEGLVVQLKPGAVPQYKLYLDESPGRTITNDWNDIQPPSSVEALGYPTQKPVALLERIVNASSNPGDVVMDPFCGCGTAIVAAQKLGRRWIGIDVTPIATSLIQKRLYDHFNARDARLKNAHDPAQAPTFRVEGLPIDEAGAIAMYNDPTDPAHKKFEMWVVGLIPAIPQEKKGADFGVDGVAYFAVGGKTPAKAVVQVKGGNVNAGDVQQLRGAMERFHAEMGFFVTLKPPTKPMEAEAMNAGFYKPALAGKQVRALQIRTVAQLLTGDDFDFPLYGSNVSLTRARTLGTTANDIGDLFEAAAASDDNAAGESVQ